MTDDDSILPDWASILGPDADPLAGLTHDPIADARRRRLRELDIDEWARDAIAADDTSGEWFDRLAASAATPEPDILMDSMKQAARAAVREAELETLVDAAGTRETVIDRALDMDDVRDCIKAVEDAGYDTLVVIGDLDTVAPGSPRAWDWYDGHEVRPIPDADLVAAVAPEAIRPTPPDRGTAPDPLARHGIGPRYRVTQPFVVTDPAGVAVTRRVETAFEWGGRDE